MGRRIGAILGVTCLLLGALAPSEEQPEGAQAFDLEEVSAFSVMDQAWHFRRGQRAECSDEPLPDVKAYPELKSDTPVYGRVPFGRGDPKSGARLEYFFVLDESDPTGKGAYNRLYFDSDRDQDLSDEEPLLPDVDPPLNAELPGSHIPFQLCFEPLSVPLGADGQLIEVMPRFVRYEQDFRACSFVATKAYKGQIEIEGHSYTAILGNDHVVAWPLNRPDTALVLVPETGPQRGYGGWWGGDRLKAFHKVDGTFYQFDAAPDGERLIVRPYAGAMGRFELGPGGRDITSCRVRGSLGGREQNVAVGDVDETGTTQMTAGCDLPVGDYFANYLSLEYGELHISLSNNYHADGQPRATGRLPVPSVRIRDDKPFVLDFSNQPEVLFASPAKGQRVKVGETLEVKGVLVDRALDIMIRELRDATETQERTISTGNSGRERTITEQRSLDPTVVITRLDGERMARGTMPFG